MANPKGRVGPAEPSDQMENVEETGFLANNGKGFFNGGSKDKSKDGDESVALAAPLGPTGEGWMGYLNDGSINPYPITSEALKTKNTRKNNDSFR